jgi:hypothetical protein
MRNVSAQTVVCVLATFIALASTPEARLGAGEVEAQSEVAELRELAERLLSPQRFMGATPAGMTPEVPQEGPSADLLVGQIAPELELDLPVSVGSRVVGSVVRRGVAVAGRVEVVIDVPGSVQEVMDFYEREFGAQGWRWVYINTTPPVTGFQQQPPAPASTRQAAFCEEGNSNPAFSVRLEQLRPDLTDARITRGGTMLPCVMNMPPSPPAGPLSRPMEPSAGPTLYLAVPTLYPPPGVELRRSPSSSAGTDSSGTEARAITTMPAADLEAFFAGQLRDLGWVRLSGSPAGTLVWSTWTVPELPDAQGLLTVHELPGTDQRLLAIRIDARTLSEQGPGPRRFGF